MKGQGAFKTIWVILAFAVVVAGAATLLSLDYKPDTNIVSAANGAPRALTGTEISDSSSGTGTSAPTSSPSQIAHGYSPPFGYFQLPQDEYGVVPANASELSFVIPREGPADLLAALAAARAARMHVYIALGDNSIPDTNADGSLSLTGFEKSLAAWCTPDSAGDLRCPDLSSYVNDGTLLGLHLFEYSVTPAPAQIDAGYPNPDLMRQAAAYAKTLWPSVATAIDSSDPCVLDGETWSKNDLNIVIVNFFTTKMDDFAHGQAVLDKDISCAEKAGLAYSWSINPFGATQTDILSSDIANYRHYLELVLLNPGAAKAVMVWRYWPTASLTVTNGVQTFQNFWSETRNPGVSGAVQEINTCAARPTMADCPSAGT